MAYEHLGNRILRHPKGGHVDAGRSDLYGFRVLILEVRRSHASAPLRVECKDVLLGKQQRAGEGRYVGVVEDVEEEEEAGVGGECCSHGGAAVQRHGVHDCSVGGVGAAQLQLSVANKLAVKPPDDDVGEVEHEVG